MQWKTNRGTFLVQDKLETIPFIYGGVGIGGERFEDAAEYIEIDRSGKIVKRYSEPLPCSIEDEMTVSNIHRVIENSLYRFYYSQYYGREPVVKTEVLLSGLEIFRGELNNF